MGDVTQARVEGDEWDAIDAVDETDAFLGEGGNFPNMMFVPQRRCEPVVEAREFAIYIGLLVMFSQSVIAQQFADDQRVNYAMRSVANMVCLEKMSTFEDYQGCWGAAGGIQDQLAAWYDSADSAIAEQGPVGIEMRPQKDALLVGMPFIYQERVADLTPGGDAVLSSFNGSHADLTHRACPWAMEVVDGLSACYSHTTSKLATEDFGAEKEVFHLSADQVRGVLNGTYRTGPYGWDHDHWFSREYTVRLGHNYLVYLPLSKRFASAHITVYFDETGQAKIEKKEFETFEPFLLDTEPFSIGIEIMFYVMMGYYLVGELFEIWDSMVLSELLLPFTVLTDSMMLSLLEIQYFHARTVRPLPRPPFCHRRPHQLRLPSLRPPVWFSTTWCCGRRVKCMTRVTPRRVRRSHFRTWTTWRST